jgi:hypothetical protein
LIQPGRELIKEGTLARVKSKRNEKDFYLFLFNDILLVTTAKEKKKKRGNTSMNRSFKHSQEVSLDGVSIMTLTDERADVYTIIMRYLPPLTTATLKSCHYHVRHHLNRR